MPRKTKYEGKWLNFYETTFTNSEGESREWEYAARTGSDGAAVIIAVVSDDIPNVVVIKQFRPPIDNYALEFPAGLIDPGESIQAAASRELEEETGYYGEVVQVGPPIYSSPGLTDEFVSMVTINVKGQAETRHEPDENIEVFTLPLPNLLDELKRIQAEGCVIDAKLWSFAQGLNWNPTGNQ
ncbi:MAG: NUDIX hydrolase [Opitutales bacterium]|jgi:8-oxo-dGTP pyrophosphatase MutT (NUDIX family)|nr:NUDIX hydrolase [Opitutales bacterium]